MWSQDTYITALRFAAQAHLGQQITGTELPYIVHISQVTMELIAALHAEPRHNDNLAIQCALLHDTIEDTAVTHADLVTQFGQAVADGVLALTKSEDLPKAERMEDSLRRIQQQPVEVWMVKLADRISNLMPPPGHWPPIRVDAYRDESRSILLALGSASPLLAARLEQRIATYAGPPA